MNGVTVVWTLVAGVSVTLAFVHFPVWLRRRGAWSSFFLSSMATGTAALALCELAMMQARTPEAYATALRTAHIPVWITTVSMVGFMQTFLRPRHLWLAWAVVGLRTLSLLLNFTVGQSLNLGTVTGVHLVPFLGETVAVGKGTFNPWMVVGNTGVVLLGLFAAEAAVGAWRAGHRGTAIRVGGAAVFFALAGVSQSVLVFGLGLDFPTTISLFSLGVLLAMAYELSCDVTRATQLTGDLRESEQRMTMAAEAANLGIWVRDLVRDDIWVSARLRELMSLSGDGPATFERLLRAIHPDDQAPVRQALARAATGVHGGQFRIEYRTLSPDGAVRWLAAQGRVEFDAAGRAVRTRGACSDVTPSRLAEGEMQRLREELAHVGRVSALGQLASALAHEINQPLGAILRNAEAAELLLRLPDPDVDEVRAIVDDILADDQRAGAVIDRMRALLRRHEFAMVPLSVHDFVGDVAALVRTDASARHVQLVVDLGHDVPPVLGDRVHLQQVLLNLLSNAMDAIDEARRSVRNIVVSAARDGAGFVQIAVADTGPGIPPDRLESIFGSFVTTKPSGMGMGLSISRSLIETHGGRLWAENQASGGASLRFTLAIAAKEKTP